MTAQSQSQFLSLSLICRLLSRLPGKRLKPSPAADGGVGARLLTASSLNRLLIAEPPIVSGGSILFPRNGRTYALPSFTRVVWRPRIVICTRSWG